MGRTAKAQCFPWSGKSFNGWVYSAIRAIAQLGFIVLFVFIPGLYGATWQRWQRRREVRGNMRRILQEREKARSEEG